MNGKRRRGNNDELGLLRLQKQSVCEGLWLVVPAGEGGMILKKGVGRKTRATTAIGQNVTGVQKEAGMQNVMRIHITHDTGRETVRKAHQTDSHVRRIIDSTGSVTKTTKQVAQVLVGSTEDPAHVRVREHTQTAQMNINVNVPVTGTVLLEIRIVNCGYIIQDRDPKTLLTMTRTAPVRALRTQWTHSARRKSCQLVHGAIHLAEILLQYTGTIEIWK